MNTNRAIFVRKFGKMGGYVILFVLFLGTVSWLGIRVFTIKNIVVVGNNIQVQVDETRLPKTLMLFPAAKLRTELLADNPILADIQFQKKLRHSSPEVNPLFWVSIVQTRRGQNIQKQPPI